jgi:toxin ParE1/3/4
MPKQVKWLHKALKNLEQAYDDVAADNPEAAIRMVLRIQAATHQLAEFPLLGKVGRFEGTRELVIAHTPYIVVYRVKGKTVDILRVLHSSKQDPD